MRQWLGIAILGVMTLGCGSDNGGAGGGTNANSLACLPEAGKRFVSEGDAACNVARGGPMRQIPLPGGGTMCIDKTEVTVGQYQQFLAEADKPQVPTSSPAAGRCNADSDFNPTCFAEPCQGDACDSPQVCVDQCDAMRFCAWAGKRLCGPIGADPLGIDFNNLHDPTKNQWMNACYSDGREWPYGPNYDGQACNTTDRKPQACGGPVTTAAFSGCQAPAGPYDQVFDLSGNVSEWVDASQEGAGWPELRCIIMGGSYLHYWGDVGCKGATLEWPCDAHIDEFGLRCCSL